MHVWRIGLLIASVVFFGFLLLRLRPRLPEAEAEQEDDGEQLSRAETRIWKRIRKLPLTSRARLYRLLERSIENDDDDGE